MAEIIRMPRLSDTMTEGVIAAWHKQVGDTVVSGDLLAEVETDKATMDVESDYEGTILHIGVEEGNGIPVGALLLIIGDSNEDVSGVVASEQNAEAPASGGNETAVESSPAPVTTAPVVESVSTPVASVSAPAPTLTPSTSTDGRVKASPLAKAIAKDRGIDISRVVGSGDNGRIVKRDIENFKEAAPTSTPAAAPIMPMVATGTESFHEETVSQMRKTIARRLSESKYSAPHFYLTMEINMDTVWKVRKSLNEVAPVKISFNDLVIKAVAHSIRQHPAVNASWLGDKIRYNQHIHVGMAVAIDDGLVVPVIRFADSKGLATISQESKDLALRARERKLQPADWQGNTFTVSNLGMFGIEEFTAIINPPDSCIMAIGAIQEKPIVKDGEIVPGRLMKVTLSCDHRVVDGASGAAFLKTFKQIMEDPMRILL